MSPARSASGVPGQVADRDARVGRAEVGDEHDPGLVVEGEHASAGRPPVDALPPAS